MFKSKGFSGVRIVFINRYMNTFVYILRDRLKNTWRRSRGSPNINMGYI